jgi:hypothetical protein
MHLVLLLTVLQSGVLLTEPSGLRGRVQHLLQVVRAVPAEYRRNSLHEFWSTVDRLTVSASRDQDPIEAIPISALLALSDEDLSYAYGEVVQQLAAVRAEYRKRAQVSVLALFHGRLSTVFQGVPASGSRVL